MGLFQLRIGWQRNSRIQNPKRIWNTQSLIILCFAMFVDYCIYAYSFLVVIRHWPSIINIRYNNADFTENRNIVENTTMVSSSSLFCFFLFFHRTSFIMFVKLLKTELRIFDWKSNLSKAISILERCKNSWWKTVKKKKYFSG